MHPGLVKDPRKSVSDADIKVWRLLGKLYSTCKADEWDLLIYIWSCCSAQQRFMLLQSMLVDREKKTSEPFLGCCFFFLLSTRYEQLFGGFINFFAFCFQNAVLASSTCTSFLFTHKEADWLWQPLKCRSKLKMLSAWGCPNGWAGSRKGSWRHPAALQGQLKDCSCSSSDFANDPNRCVISSQYIMFSLPV